jgi:hypothetical protein
MANPRPYTAQQAIDAIRKKKGNLTAAAKVLGVHRCGLSTYANATPTVKRVLDECRASRIDRAESVLDWALYAEGVPAVVRLKAAEFTLKTIGKDRGYLPTEKREHEITKPVRIQFEDSDDVDRGMEPED